MGLSKLLSKQMRKPDGILGRVLMSRFFEKGNAAHNSFMFENLSLKGDEHILEIGFGPGALLKRAAACLENGLAEGIDFSKAMAATARKKNKEHIKNGSVKIYVGDFNEVEFSDNCFDQIFSVNTIYFWKDPAVTISKISRLLKPGGRLILGFLERSDMEKFNLNLNVFRLYSAQEVAELMSEHGSFESIKLVSRKDGEDNCYCAVGVKRL